MMRSPATDVFNRRTCAGIAIALLHGCASGGGATGAAPPPVVATPSVGPSVSSAVSTMNVPSNSVGQTTALPAPVDAVWALLPGVYESLSLPISVKDDAARRLGNAQIRARRSLGRVPMRAIVDCGSDLSGEKAETYDVRLSIETVVAAGQDANTATVTTLVNAVGRSPQFSGVEVACGSKGELERRIARSLRTQLETPR